MPVRRCFIARLVPCSNLLSCAMLIDRAEKVDDELEKDMSSAFQHMKAMCKSLVLPKCAVTLELRV
jgi:hypothetical protein